MSIVVLTWGLAVAAPGGPSRRVPLGERGEREARLTGSPHCPEPQDPVLPRCVHRPSLLFLSRTGPRASGERRDGSRCRAQGRPAYSRGDRTSQATARSENNAATILPLRWLLPVQGFGSESLTLGADAWPAKIGIDLFLTSGVPPGVTFLRGGVRCSGPYILNPTCFGDVRGKLLGPTV